MPLDERRGDINNLMEKNNINELTGAIKNSLEYEENLGKIKQSFINAGYKFQEIEIASRNLIQPKLKNQSQTPPVLKPVKLKPISEEIKKNESFTENQAQPNKKSPIPIILIITISVLVLVGAAILGLYWDKIF